MLIESNSSLPWRDPDGKLTDESWSCIAVRIFWCSLQYSFLNKGYIDWLIDHLAARFYWSYPISSLGNEIQGLKLGQNEITLKYACSYVKSLINVQNQMFFLLLLLLLY